MAILNFPVSPVNGQIYPSNPVTGEKVYQWSTTEQTWVLLGLVSGVIPGIYGTSLEIPQFTVNFAGRIEAAQNVPIQIADTTQIGITRLTTPAEAETGTDDTIAVTPLGLRTSAVYKSDFVAKGDILSASGAATPLILPVGTDGQFLIANSTEATGLRWSTAADAGVVVGVTGITPITVDNTVPSEPVVSLDDTTVTPGTYDYASFTVDEKGRLTFASTNTTPNTTVITPILNTGTTVEPIISLADTSVVPGTYNYSSFTVDEKGRLTFAATNTTPNTTVVAPITNTGTTVEPVIGVDPASTTSAGVVQLNDTTASTSTTEALTAAQGKKLQDQITSLIVGGVLTNAGTFNASTGLMTNVSVAGAAAGFVVGQDVPSPSPALLDYFVQITVAGTYSPPGGGGPYDMVPGDWLFCNGTAWIQVEIGTRLPYASTTEPGAVELSTNAETQSGTDATLAVTPASLQSKVSNSVSTTSSTTIASSTAVRTAYDLADAALPKSGGIMTGVITFAAGQTIPVGGIQDATTGTKGVVQIGTNVQVSSGIISILNSSTTNRGVVQLNDNVNSISVTEAATANAVKTTYDLANAALSRSGGTMTGVMVFAPGQTLPVGGIQDATTGAKGVVQIGSNVQVSGGVISVLDSSTTNSGVVQLVDDTTTIDASKALTAAAGYNLQQQINQLDARVNLTFAGTIDGTTGLMLTVTAQGAAAGFLSGSVLPAPSSANDEYFVVVTVPGTFTPPSSPSVTAIGGDWLVSDGTEWVYYNVGGSGVASFQQIDDISGLFDGVRLNFPIQIAGVDFAPGNSANIIISVGGVMQLAGPAFSVTGSTITFTAAPETSTTFAGYVVSNGVTGGSGGGTGSVTSVGTGVGLTGGPIITTGTISLDTATTSTLGGVIVDGVTINVSPAGVISTAPGVGGRFVYLDDISPLFNGVRFSFTLGIGGSPVSPDDNLLVFVGGVPQANGPGASYTISGPTITFTTAPPAGASFIGVTVV